MRVRFREKCASSNPDFPFEAGQVIAVDVLSREIHQALERGQAEIVDEPAQAALGPPAEVATQRTGKRRGPR